MKSMQPFAERRADVARAEVGESGVGNVEFDGRPAVVTGTRVSWNNKGRPLRVVSA